MSLIQNQITPHDLSLVSHMPLVYAHLYNTHTHVLLNRKNVIGHQHPYNIVSIVVEGQQYCIMTLMVTYTWAKSDTKNSKALRLCSLVITDLAVMGGR